MNAADRRVLRRAAEGVAEDVATIVESPGTQVSPMVIDSLSAWADQIQIVLRRQHKTWAKKRGPGRGKKALKGATGCKGKAPVSDEDHYVASMAAFARQVNSR